MLLILYGGTGTIGAKSRAYLESRGFPLIEKYYYEAEDIKVTTIHGHRRVVSREQFEQETDTLFRYEMGGYQVGFSQKQIMDAVADKENRLLTMSSTDLSVLSEIKRVHGDQACLIYMYIDDTTLRSLVDEMRLPESGEPLDEAEKQFRYETGQRLRDCYLSDSTLFDRVVLYGGENSKLNAARLCTQFDAIVKLVKKPVEETAVYEHVFISFAGRDRKTAEMLSDELTKLGVSTFVAFSEIFYDSWRTAIQQKILHAKVVVVIVTEHLRNSEAALAEMRMAMEAARNGGTVVIPFFIGQVETAGCPELEELALRVGVCADVDDVEGGISRMAETVRTLADGERRLAILAEKVENYLSVNSIKGAVDALEEYRALCTKLYELSHGKMVDVNALARCMVRQATLLYSMGWFDRARALCVEVINMYLPDEMDGSLLSEAVTLLVSICAGLDMSEQEFEQLLHAELMPYLLEDGVVDELLKCFRAAGKTDCGAHGYNAGAAHSQEYDIADYGKRIMDMFEALIREEAATEGKFDLLEGYRRLLNYCKYNKLTGDVANLCAERIAELSDSQGSIVLADDGPTRALKVYLGKPLPGTGEYDVFISHKSEDKELARKVYEFLRQNNKEVFFSPYTLSELGESQYRRQIFEAMEHSKHMVVVASNPDYLKTNWVSQEWGFFHDEKLAGRKAGNLLLVMSDNVAGAVGRFPGELRNNHEIIRTGEFRERLLSYLW